MKNKSIIISITAVIIVLGIGYGLPRYNLKSQTLKTPQPYERKDHNEEREEHHEDSEIVELSDIDAKAAGIETDKVSFGTGNEIRILGRIIASPEAKVMIGAPISGRVAKVFVSSGSKVSKGTPLLEIVSAEAVGIIADARVASANLNMAKANANAAQLAYSSDELLYAKGIISRRELENSKASSISASSKVAAYSAYLSAANAKIGATGAPNNNGAIVIRAPITGVVNNMPLSVDGFVPQGAMVGEIINIESTEAVLQITPNFSDRLSIGSKLKVETNEGKSYFATIKSISPGTDSGSYNLVVRAKIDDAILPLGTIISARIIIQNGANNLRPIVPSNSIIAIGDAKKIFIKSKNGFSATSVITGNSFNGQTEIINGLRGNEIIVVKNAFLLKSQLAKGEVEHEH